MSGALPFLFKDQELVLLKEKAIYWKNESALVLSDLHLGKVAHFRKEGLAVPMDAADREYHLLDSILKEYPISKILIAGDFSHSFHNEELDRFAEWQSRNSHLEIVLIKGNHDLLPSSFYHKAKMEVIEDKLEYGPFVISHKPLDKCKLYNIAGHIHPGVELVGKARQRFTLSCFYFGKKMALLPAFGSFTGNCKISVKKGDKVFVIAENKVVEVS